MMTIFACKGQSSVALIKDEKTVFTIIYPRNASAVNINAAKQLAIHLNKVSKANFKLAVENYGLQNNIISVGNTALYQKNISPLIKSPLGKDGIVIKTLGQNLFLNGATDQAVLYAVYQFLEDQVKIKFLTPEVFDYPDYKNLTINIINVVYTPPFFYRSHYAYNPNVSAEFATILKENGDFSPLKEIWGKPHRFLGWVHTFSQILPPKKYFSAHPEWFADPANGYLPCTKSSSIPADQETQLCLSDNKMQAEFLKQLLIRIKEDPTYDLISLSQNDNKGFCKCSACTRIINEEGAASGLLLRFVNFMAAAVAKQYPNKTIETLAYYATETPPLKTKPNKNVMIRFAPIDANMAYPIESEQNHRVNYNIKKWAEISNQNFFWGYNTNFRHAVLPYPSLSKTLTDLKYLQKQQFKGVFIQDNTNPEGFGYFLDMQAWVIAKMMWNPNQNEQVLIEQFFNSYYGASGKSLLAYYKLIENAFKKSGVKLLAYHTDYSFIKELDIKNANLLFNQALASALGNKTLTERVNKEKISFDFLLAFIGEKTSAEKGKFFKDLMDKTYPNENVNYALKKYNRTLIEEVETEDAKRNAKFADNVIKIEQGKFVLYRKGFATNIEYDAAAEDKLAATISGENRDWAIQYIIKSAELPKAANYGVSALVRADKKSNQIAPDSKINFGVYDPQDKIEIIKQEIATNKLISNTYVKVNFGNVVLKSGYVIYFSISGAESNIDRLFVDGIIFNKK